MDTVGKMVKIEARVSGSQPLTVSWYKDNNKILSSDKHQVSFQNNLAMLAIQDSSCSDTGLYSCTVSNEAGQASCEVSLTVSGRTLFFYLLAANNLLCWVQIFVFGPFQSFLCSKQRICQVEMMFFLLLVARLCSCFFPPTRNCPATKVRRPVRASRG